MKWLQVSASAVVLALAASACSENPESPAPRAVVPSASMQAAPPKGTGLVLNSLTGLSLPLVGSLGNVTISQTEITNFALLENTVGSIVGLEVDGVLQLTGGVLGTNVVSENFNTTASITSSGPGQCTLVSLDLGSIDLSALGLTSIDVPTATITGKGSGAVGSLLCNLGSLLGGLTSGITGGTGAQGVVTALNNQIGG